MTSQMSISAESLERELRTVFANEATDSLNRVESLLERRRRNGADQALIEALFREFHTMKVGAAAAGLSGAARELHDAESLLDAVRNGARTNGLEALDGVVMRVREAVGPCDDIALESLQMAALWPALVRSTAEAAATERKFAVLATDGGDLSVPRPVGGALRGALLHLVRNAVAHGIEPPATREAAGKGRVGLVRIHASGTFTPEVELPRGKRRARQARATGGRTVSRLVQVDVTVEDDGAGLDFDAIATRARALGWVNGTLPSRDELAALIYRSGFSTRDGANTIAGRGVGMDAVAHAVNGLGGSIAVESRDGAGCTVRLAIPIAG